jgi:hypothetical protein
MTAKKQKKVKTSSSASLEKFVDELIQKKNIPQLTDEIRQQMKQDLLVRLNDFLNAKLIAYLSNKQAKELEELVSKDSDIKKVQQFFQDNIKNLPDVVADILADFRKIYLGTA